MALTFYAVQSIFINGEQYASGDLVEGLTDSQAILFLKRGLIAADGGGAASGGDALVPISRTVFSAAASVSLNADTFTDEFDNYTAFLRVDSASVDGSNRFRMRSAGVDNSASNYLVQGVEFENTGSSIAGGNGDYGVMSYQYAANLSQMQRFEILSPHLALQTTIYELLSYKQSGLVLRPTMCQFTAPTVFDSMTIYRSSGIFSGVIDVYGYRIPT